MPDITGAVVSSTVNVAVFLMTLPFESLNLYLTLYVPGFLTLSFVCTDMPDVPMLNVFLSNAVTFSRQFTDLPRSIVRSLTPVIVLFLLFNGLRESGSVGSHLHCDGMRIGVGFPSGPASELLYITTVVPEGQFSRIHLASLTASRMHPAEAVLPSRL